MKFNADYLRQHTELGGRVILFELPVLEKNKNSCHIFEDENLFISLVGKHEAFKEIKGVFVNGIYAITFSQCNDTDEELITFVAECASKCVFL